MKDEQIKRLYDALEESRFTVAITGAGISLAAGGVMLSYDIYSQAGLWTEGAKKAQEWIRQADLILIIGTNGYYGSVYWDYRKPDAAIIQINPRKTNFDSAADLNIREEADPVFEMLMKLQEENV